METTNGQVVNQLQTLADSNYELQEGQPDIRGWEVKNASGDYIGIVEELLFDVANEKIRYLIVDFNLNELGLDEHLVLIPVGLAEVHEHDDEVILPSVTTEQLRELHPYHEADFGNDKEESVQAAFIGTAGVAGDVMPAGKSTYDQEYFDEANLYKRRRQSEETALFPINEDLDDRIDLSADDNLIDGADLDIPERDKIR